MVYREKSEARMMTETFLRDFKSQTGRDIETLDPDSRAGQSFIETYDIVQYPTLIALEPDGVEATRWVGDFPTISEASGY